MPDIPLIVSCSYKFIDLRQDIAAQQQLPRRFQDIVISIIFPVAVWSSGWKERADTAKRLVIGKTLLG